MGMAEEQRFLPPDPAALAAERATPATPGDEPPATSAAGETLIAHHDALMNRPGVVMIGETLDALGRPAIVIGVRTAGDLGGLPSTIDGVPVVTQVIGEVDAQR